MTEDELALQAYSMIAEQIIKEDARINERITWGISINGGLLALLGVSYAPLKDIFALASGPASLALAFLAAAAMLVCHQTIRGVGDARKQIYYIRKIYEAKWKGKIEDEIGLPRPFGSREFYTEQESGAAKSLWWGENLFFIIGSFWLMIVLTSLIASIFATWSFRLGSCQ
jgi:hypothetical protein